MDAKRWLLELRGELARRKLPPLYVERLVVELSDHLNDLMEDRMSTDAKDLHGVFSRFGSPGHVADSAAKEYRKSRFSRRHPILMFLVLPILSLPVLWFVGLVACGLLAKMLGLEYGKASPEGPLWQWANASVPYLVVAFLVLPLAIAAWFFSSLARRAAVGWKWPLATCVLLAVLGSLLMTRITLPTTSTHGQFMVGFGVRTNPTASQWLQFLVPLSIGAWAVWRHRAGQRGVGPALRA